MYCEKCMGHKRQCKLLGEGEKASTTNTLFNTDSKLLAISIKQLKIMNQTERLIIAETCCGCPLTKAIVTGEIRIVLEAKVEKDQKEEIIEVPYNIPFNQVIALVEPYKGSIESSIVVTYQDVQGETLENGTNFIHVSIVWRTCIFKK